MRTKLATLLAVLCLFAIPLDAFAQNNFTQVDLVADVSGEAGATDANLVNPWGLAPGGNCTFWVANEGTGTSTLYSPAGVSTGLVVNIPGGSPTGVVLANDTNLRFSFSKGDSVSTARFIFVTTNGTISAWSPTFDPSNAVQVATNDGAAYTGAAIASTASGARIYAANFGECSIDVYDSSFVQITPSGSFIDPNLPAGYCPFNIANINGQLYVAYALKSGNEEVPGPGNGYINVYDTNGTFLSRLVSAGELNAPWAMVVAPGCFGDFSGDLLVGNFGDGRILAYSLGDGSFQGSFLDENQDPITIEGLWGLATCSGAGSEVACRLYFAAGPDDETHGLFGYIEPTEDGEEPPPPGGGGETCENHARGLGFWSKACRDNGNRGGNGNGNGNQDKDKHGNGLGVGLGHTSGLGNGKNGHGMDSDSLDALFDSISESNEAFGGSGCFTADCELLSARGHRSKEMRVAQDFLVLLLNREAGMICDDNAVSCRNGDDDIETVGDIVARVNDRLCAGDRTDDELDDLDDLIACALRSADGVAAEDEEGLQARNVFQVPSGRLQVKTLSGNPLRPSAGVQTRMQLSTD
ncbi:MAG TPA: TIGR03118 family protein, partial [Candidatus Eisenbacteria bacterium]|nr:TIGR03118 family protein [Candidatus Eisenbacteria bacterium]